MVPSDAMSKYLAEISHLPVLSREEEQDLAMRWYNEKDREAAEKLVVANLKFVVKIAKEYSRYGFKMSELVQEGNMGLMHAVQKFDPTKNYRLISYAVWWIRAYIQSFILKSWSIVRSGTTRAQRKLFSSLQKTRRELASLNPEERVSNAQLAEALDMDQKTFAEELARMETRDVSMDQPLLSSDEQGRTVGDTFEDEKADTEAQFISMDLSEKVRDRLDDIYDDLKPRERFLLENRLLSDDPITLEAAGTEFGVTRERVRQIEAELKKKLKKVLVPLMGGQKSKFMH